MRRPVSKTPESSHGRPEVFISPSSTPIPTLMSPHYTAFLREGLDELVNCGHGDAHLTVASAIVGQQPHTAELEIGRQTGEATACDAGQRRMWVKRRTSLNIIDLTHGPSGLLSDGGSPEEHRTDVRSTHAFGEGLGETASDGEQGECDGSTRCDMYSIIIAIMLARVGRVVVHTASHRAYSSALTGALFAARRTAGPACRVHIVQSRAIARGPG